MRLSEYLLDLVLAIGLVALISPNEGFEGVIAVTPAKRAVWMCELDVHEDGDWLIAKVTLPDRVPIARARHVQNHVTRLSNRPGIVGGFFAYDPATRMVRFQAYLDVAGQVPDERRFQSFVEGAVRTADEAFPEFRRLIAGTARCSRRGHRIRRW